MINKEIELLLSQGYIKLPNLRSTEDPKDIIADKHSGTYSTGSDFQTKYHEMIDLDKITSQLSDIATSKFNIKVNKTDIYKILKRMMPSLDNRTLLYMAQGIEDAVKQMTGGEE